MNRQRLIGCGVWLGAFALGACGGASSDDRPLEGQDLGGASAEGEGEVGRDVVSFENDTRDIVVDEEGGPIGPGRRPTAYTLNGSRWTKQVVTWYVQGTDARLRNAVIVSLNAWDSVTKVLDFQEGSSAAAADIVVKRDDTLGEGVEGLTTRSQYGDGALTHCDIRIKLSGLTGTHDNYLRAVTMHEVGHAIGMGHSTVDNAVMKSTIVQVHYLDGTVIPLINYLIEEDINGAQSLYGMTNSSTYRYLPYPWRVLGTSPTRANQYNQWPFVDIDIAKFRNSTLQLSVVCDKGTIGCK